MAAVGTTPVWAAPLASPPAADPGSVDFNDAFTNTSHGSVDVSRFKKGNPVLPGTYRVDIFLNEMRVDRGDIVFRSVEGSDVAQPCFSPAMLSRFGVDMLKLDSSIGEEKSDCITMRNISADAMAEMDVGTLRLNLSIPQDSLIQRARGYVNPELWDQGETALLASYNVNVHSVDQTFSSRANVFGTAVGIDGLPISVRDGTRYSLGSDGGYVANPNGGYMLRPDGTYAAVSPGGYLAPNRDGNGYNNVNAFLGVNLGLNAGGWRIRSFGTGQWDQRTGHTNWRNVNTTATHDISDWKAQITFGDGHTQGQVFDSAPYRGVTLYSDDRMLPDSQQGYAPVIRGMANTQARVEVRQNGNLLYEATVAPGPFTINDLYSTGYGGDLIVTVFEADGSMHTISVPFSAVPMLLRPGVSRWSITNGQYRTQTLQNNKPYYLEGTYQRGINNWLTLYGGVQTTYRALYKSYLGGMAFNTPVGAVGFDITNSHTNFVGGKNNSISGYSSRLSYSKVLPTAGTTFALATYRYSNRGFLSLDDAVARQDYGTTIGSPEGLMNLPRTKQRLQITLNQNLGEGSKYGSLYFNGSRYSYWNDNADATTYMLGYSQSIRRVNFGITASRSYSSSRIFHGSRFDNQFGLNISVPLGSQLGAPTFMFNGTHDDVYGNTDRATVSGAFGDHRQFNYNGGVSYSNNRTTTTSTVNGGLGWRAAYGSLGANYSHARNYRQASANLSGGLVAHPGGITLAPQLSFDDPIAVVEAADAQGARVASSGTARIDGRGYAIATGLLPYRMNDVTLDPAGSSMNVELQTTRLQTAPRAGAVVPLKFNTVKGRAVLIRATQPNGEALPFGADVLDANGQNVGIVGQGGQMFVRSAESGGMLAVRWGDQPHQACHLRYELPARSTSQANTTIENAEGRCE
jgi:outer membrane usher protein